MSWKISIFTVLVAVLLTSVPWSNVQAQNSPWQIRLRGIVVAPDESATITVIGGDVDVGTVFVPELDITYFLSERFALELILATTKHNVKAEDTALGDVDLGSVRLLPPILTLQYHLAPGARIRPYVGAGVNLTIFYDGDAPGGVVTDIDYKSGFGVSLQAGVDFALQGNWFLNVDVKKVFLNTDVSLNGGAITADVSLDPWIFGLGVGYRF